VETPVVNESPEIPAPLLEEVFVPSPESVLTEDVYDPKKPEGYMGSNVSLLELVKEAQELDPQCRRIISQLRGTTQPDPLLALVPRSLPQFYSVDKGNLLRFVDRVLVPAQESL